MYTCQSCKVIIASASPCLSRSPEVGVLTQLNVQPQAREPTTPLGIQAVRVQPTQRTMARGRVVAGRVALFRHGSESALPCPRANLPSAKLSEASRNASSAARDEKGSVRHLHRIRPHMLSPPPPPPTPSDPISAPRRLCRIAFHAPSLHGASTELPCLFGARVYERT